MARKPSPDHPICPYCGAPHGVRHGSKEGRPRWVCRPCRCSFGLTNGTPMGRRRTPPAEVGRTRLLWMRRGSLRAAEEISGHKSETIGRWLRLATQHPQAIPEGRVEDLPLPEVEAFWSFGEKRVPMRESRPARRAKGALAGEAGRRTGPRAWGSPGRLGLRKPPPFPRRCLGPVRERRGGGGVPWGSEGRDPDRAEIRRGYRDPPRIGKRGPPPLGRTPGLRLPQAVKPRQRGRVVRGEVRAVLGDPVACPDIVHRERWDGVWRDKTHAFARAPGPWDALVTLCWFEPNWMRPPPALREDLFTPCH